LLTDPARAATMGRAARDFVTGTLSWNAALAPLAQLTGCGPEAARNAA
jgi:polysaccharide biosynthesis protein PslH